METLSLISSLILIFCGLIYMVDVQLLTEEREASFFTGILLINLCSNSQGKH